MKCFKVLAVVCLEVGLSGCSGSVSSSVVEYRVSSTAEQVGVVSYHTVQLGAGSVDFEDRVRKPTWLKRVEGGRSPRVSVVAPATGTASCEIRSAGGKVLAHETKTNGASALCKAGDHDLRTFGRPVKVTAPAS